MSDNRASREARTWDAHWAKLQSDSSTFGRIASFVRRGIISRAVRSYTGRFFAREGVFVEAGCGTGESSLRIDRAAGRTLIAADLSLGALQLARRANFDGFVSADAFHLPFADASIQGIWNLGVMEHFVEDQGVAMLREFARVLVPGGKVILFWPPEFGSSRLVLGPVEKFLSWRGRRRFHFFPDEVNRLRSRAHGAAVLRAAGLEPLASEFSARDAFIHVVLVGQKP